MPATGTGSVAAPLSGIWWGIRLCPKAGVRGVPPGSGPLGADRSARSRPNGPGLRTGPNSGGQRRGQRLPPSSSPPAPEHATRLPPRAPARLRSRDTPGDNPVVTSWDGDQIDLVDQMFTLTTTIALRALSPPTPDPRSIRPPAPRLRHLPGHHLHPGCPAHGWSPARPLATATGLWEPVHRAAT
jgi:hypothetical protein